MASEAAAPTRHEGAGVARRAAFHERLRAERAELEAAAGAGLPPETDDVALVRAVDVLDGVAEAGRNYTLLKPAPENADAIDGFTPVPTYSYGGSAHTRL